MKQLKQLSLADNKITNTEPLVGLIGLNRLDLARNGIDDWSNFDGIKRVNGRPYKLHVQFCYQRELKDYARWQLTTRRMDPQYPDAVTTKTESVPFKNLEENDDALATILLLDYDMISDKFEFVIQEIKNTVNRDYAGDRVVDIDNTLGEVKITVCVFENKKKIYVGEWNE